jgi:hypothetical protein
LEQKKTKESKVESNFVAFVSFCSSCRRRPEGRGGFRPALPPEADSVGADSFPTPGIFFLVVPYELALSTFDSYRVSGPNIEAPGAVPSNAGVESVFHPWPKMLGAW